ncbi:MAG: DMT family transporter [Candidatus Caldatribacteriaceae bacterium]
MQEESTDSTSSKVAMDAPLGEGLKVYFPLSLVSLIWGLNFPIMRLGVLALGPLVFPFFRFLFSVPLFFLVLWIRERSVKIAFRDVPLFLFLGFIGFGLYQPLWSFGLKLSLASHSALLLSLSPVIVAAIVFLRKEEGFQVVNLLGVLFGFLGVVLLAYPRGGSSVAGHSMLLGDLVTLGAAFLWGLYCYLGKFILSRYSPLKSSTWSMFFGVVTMFPLCFRDVLKAPFENFSLTLFLIFLYGTLLSSLLAYVFWMQGIQKIGASRTTAFQYVTQIFGVIGARLFFHDPLDVLLFGSMAFVSLGLLLAQWRRRVEEV